MRRDKGRRDWPGRESKRPGADGGRERQLQRKPSTMRQMIGWSFRSHSTWPQTEDTDTREISSYRQSQSLTQGGGYRFCLIVGFLQNFSLQGIHVLIIVFDVMLWQICAHVIFVIYPILARICTCIYRQVHVLYFIFQKSRETTFIDNFLDT